MLTISLRRFVLAALLGLAALGGVVAQTAPPAGLIQVSARGFVRVAPDTAVIRFAIQGQNPKLDEAYAQARRQAGQVRALLRTQGIPAAAAHWSAYSMQPNIDWRTHVTTGYTVTLGVSVALTDFKQIGPLVDAAGQQGIAAFRSVGFELRHAAAAKRAAIIAGYRRARVEAETLAGAAGRRLGPLQGATVDVIQPSPIFAPPMMRAMASGGLMQAPIAQFKPQRIEVSATVRAAFALQGGK